MREVTYLEEFLGLGASLILAHGAMIGPLTAPYNQSSTNQTNTGLLSNKLHCRFLTTYSLGIYL